MKKILLAIAAVAMLFATSCKNNNAPEDITLGENEFLATIDNGANPQNAPRVSDGMSTMTTIDANRYVIWEQDDEITINSITYTTNTSGNSVVFSTDGTKATGSDFHAFYPASIAGSGAAGTLSATQTYESGTVRNLPMYAHSTTHQLTFNNICAVLKITIPSYVDGATSIEVSSDQAMNGAFTIQGDSAKMTNASPTDAEKKITIAKTSGTFATDEVVYIAVPAGQYTNLKIKFVGGASAWEKTLASCTLRVNKIYPINMTENYFCFTAKAANSSVTITKGKLATAVNLEYKRVLSDTVDQNWTSLTTNTTGTTISLPNVGDKVYFRADASGNTQFAMNTYSTPKANTFTGTGDLEVSGNIMYLLNQNPSTSLTAGYSFCNLFNGNTALTDASKLILPATTLTESCYAYMFSNCSTLVAAPALPAANLVKCCYLGMFKNCTSLTTAPELSATTLVERCYNSMFQSCSKLSSITMKATDVSASSCILYLVYNAGTDASVTSRTVHCKSTVQTAVQNQLNSDNSSWTAVGDVP